MMAPDVVRPWDLAPGDVVRVGRRLAPGIVREVREPSHGLAAAHGFVVVVVDFERMSSEDRARLGIVYRHTFTLRPGEVVERLADDDDAAVHIRRELAGA